MLCKHNGKMSQAVNRDSAAKKRGASQKIEPQET